MKGLRAIVREHILRNPKRFLLPSVPDSYGWECPFCIERMGYKEYRKRRWHPYTLEELIEHLLSDHREALAEIVLPKKLA